MPRVITCKRRLPPIRLPPKGSQLRNIFVSDASEGYPHWRLSFVDGWVWRAYKTVKAGSATARTVASPEDKANFNRLRLAAPANDLTAQIIPKIPEYPEDVLKRFPSLREHQSKLEEWRIRTNLALRGGVQ